MSVTDNNKLTAVQTGRVLRIGVLVGYDAATHTFQFKFAAKQTTPEGDIVSGNGPGYYLVFQPRPDTRMGVEKVKFVSDASEAFIGACGSDCPQGPMDNDGAVFQDVMLDASETMLTVYNTNASCCMYTYKLGLLAKRKGQADFEPAPCDPRIINQ